MNRLRKRKLIFVVWLCTFFGAAVLLALYALRQNISLFFAPAAIMAGDAPLNTPIRIGGMVVKKSVLKTYDRVVHFQITDFKHTIEVRYQGILPDLFREGQGIVAQGYLSDKRHFMANQVLAKHDEKYMPPEVKEALK